MLTEYTEWLAAASKWEQRNSNHRSPLAFIFDFRLIKETGSGLCYQASLPTHRKFRIKSRPNYKPVCTNKNKQREREGSVGSCWGSRLQIGEIAHSSSYSPGDKLITQVSPTIPKGFNCLHCAHTLKCLPTYRNTHTFCLNNAHNLKHSYRHTHPLTHTYTHPLTHTHTHTKPCTTLRERYLYQPLIHLPTLPWPRGLHRVWEMRTVGKEDIRDCYCMSLMMCATWQTSSRRTGGENGRVSEREQSVSCLSWYLSNLIFQLVLVELNTVL